MFSYRRVKNDLLTELPGDAVVGTRVIRLGWLDFRAVIDDGDVPRELSELVVPPLGSLEVTGDLFLQLYPTLTPTSRFRTLRSHTGPVNGVAFAPDGRTLATTSGPDRQMVGIVPLPQVRKR